MSSETVASLVRELYAIVRRLEAEYPGRPFTPDGHLVGSIGEVLAAGRYGLRLLPPSTERHDAVAGDGRLVQIKATGTKSVGLYSPPDYLIVLQLDEQGGAQEVYNGPGGPVWERCGKMQKTGQRMIAVSTLRRLNEEVLEGERVTPSALSGTSPKYGSVSQDEY
jgi:hypothetical protein